MRESFKKVVVQLIVIVSLFSVDFARAEDPEVRDLPEPAWHMALTNSLAGRTAAEIVKPIDETVDGLKHEVATLPQDLFRILQVWKPPIDPAELQSSLMQTLWTIGIALYNDDLDRVAAAANQSLAQYSNQTAGAVWRGAKEKDLPMIAGGISQWVWGAVQMAMGDYLAGTKYPRPELTRLAIAGVSRNMAGTAVAESWNPNLLMPVYFASRKNQTFEERETAERMREAREAARREKVLLGMRAEISRRFRAVQESGVLSLQVRIRELRNLVSEISLKGGNRPGSVTYALFVDISRCRTELVVEKIFQDAADFERITPPAASRLESLSKQISMARYTVRRYFPAGEFSAKHQELVGKLNEALTRVREIRKDLAD